MPAAAPSAELVDWLCVLVRRGVRVGSGKGKSLAAFFGFKPVIPPRKASGLLTLELVSEKLYIGISMIFLVGDGCLVPPPQKQKVKDEKRLCCAPGILFLGPPAQGGGKTGTQTLRPILILKDSVSRKRLFSTGLFFDWIILGLLLNVSRVDFTASVLVLGAVGVRECCCTAVLPSKIGWNLCAAGVPREQRVIRARRTLTQAGWWRRT